MPDRSPKLRHCILHLGTEKTGTSTLQRFLINNRKVLKQNGIGLSTVAGWANNRRIAAYFQPRLDDGYFQDNKIYTADQRDEHFKSFEDDFISEIDRLPQSVDTVILTTEFFHSRLTTVESVEGLKRLLSKRFSSFRLICYFREQSSLARSLYSTSIKGGGTHAFERFTRYVGPKSHYYNCLTISDLWSSVFSEHPFSARIFDKDALIGGDILTDFMTTVFPALPTTDFAPPEKRQNEGLGGVGIAVGRAVNSVYPRYDSDGNLSERRKRIMATIENSLFCRSGSLHFPSAIDIYEQFDESNREFARRYLGMEDNPFKRPRHPFDEQPATDMDEWRRLIEDILRSEKE